MIFYVLYTQQEAVMCAKELSEGKDVGEMWAAVIKDINNLLQFRTRAPNGDRAGVSRCSEGDHAGHIREVPREEHSPSMYMLNHVLILKRNCNLSTVYC